MIESEIEERLRAAFAAALPDGASLVCSRSVADEGEVATDGEDDAACVVSVAAAFRAHDDFSLPMLSVTVSATVATRIERDPSAALHEAAAAALAALLSRWHFRPDEMTDALTTAHFAAGALKMTGGSARELDRDGGIRRETVSFQVMGSEIFTETTETETETKEG